MNPLLVQEWDWDKNVILPSQVTTGTTKKCGGNAMMAIHGEHKSSAEIAVLGVLIAQVGFCFLDSMICVRGELILPVNGTTIKICCHHHKYHSGQ